MTFLTGFSTLHERVLSSTLNSSPRPVFVARDQGKSPPRLHKARVEVTGIKAVDMKIHSLPFQLAPPRSEAVGPMKPLRGPTPVAGEKGPDP